MNYCSAKWREQIVNKLFAKEYVSPPSLFFFITFSQWHPCELNSYSLTILRITMYYIFQMLHFFLGFIGLPRGQENVSAKSRLFERAPMHLNRPILCMSSFASVTIVSESLVSHHSLKMKEIMKWTILGTLESLINWSRVGDSTFSLESVH